MNVPDDLRYSAEHEWIRRDGDVVTVGITDFAQDALGDVVFVELPALELEVERNSTCAEIESTKSVSEIYAPLAGTIVEINDSLETSPELVNSDPYGDGWIFRVKLKDVGEVEGLLDAPGYRAVIEQ